METPKLLRVAEVAKLFNVSRPTVYRMVNAGQLEAYSIAGSIRVPAEAVQRYLMTSRVNAPGHDPTPVRAIDAVANAKRPASRGAYVPVRPTAEMLAERKAWQIARKMAVKLVAADATDAEWDNALQTAYREARKRLLPNRAK